MSARRATCDSNSDFKWNRRNTLYDNTQATSIPGVDTWVYPYITKPDRTGETTVSRYFSTTKISKDSGIGFIFRAFRGFRGSKESSLSEEITDQPSKDELTTDSVVRIIMTETSEFRLFDF